VEYTYRLGRIYHETGDTEKAIDYYQQTVTRGKTEPYYFAAGAAYQMGLLYENMGNDARAVSAYSLCLSIKPVEYKTSLHQKAKAGLKRLKTGKPKI
jgi:tetratricopeptide (TPR) repeat protein